MAAQMLDELLRAAAERTPLAPAVSAADGELSYRELHELASRIGAGLRELGVRPGDRVGLLGGENHRHGGGRAWCALLRRRVHPARPHRAAGLLGSADRRLRGPRRGRGGRAAPPAGRGDAGTARGGAERRGVSVRHDRDPG